MANRNRVDLKSYVRFQLTQLSARNGQHEFERIAYELARLRIAPNLLPATGPVQSGGDQGRDFESYHTYLGQSPIANSAFLAKVSSEVLVGACSIEKKIASKIKSDLKSIFGTGKAPDRVVYYCVADVPVGTRHKLQEHCRKTYHSLLEIFDGQAIADQLADPDTFWIAEEFLSIPSDAWPNEPVSPKYAALRNKWLSQQKLPQNYADFLDIKRGIRTATFEKEAKVDLGGWMKCMQFFLDNVSSTHFTQKARYEIAVAELRGRGSLDPAIPLVKEFFKSLSTERQYSELFDAAVLSVYVFGAVVNRHTTMPTRTAKALVRKAAKTISDALLTVSDPGDRCTLLEARAMIGAAQWTERSEQFWLSLLDIWQ